MKIFSLALILLMPLAAWAQKGGQEDDWIFEYESGKSALLGDGNRYISIMAGMAILDDEIGFHAEASVKYQPRIVSFGAFTNFVRVPQQHFSNWTLIGMHLGVTPTLGPVSPYISFDYGMFNFQIINSDANFRTGSLGLGGGVEHEIAHRVSVLFDFRWKRFVDYGGERDAFNVWAISAGVKF